MLVRLMKNKRYYSEIIADLEKKVQDQQKSLEEKNCKIKELERIDEENKEKIKDLKEGNAKLESLYLEKVEENEMLDNTNVYLSKTLADFREDNARLSEIEDKHQFLNTELTKIKDQILYLLEENHE